MKLVALPDQSPYRADYHVIDDTPEAAVTAQIMQARDSNSKPANWFNVNIGGLPEVHVRLTGGRGVGEAQLAAARAVIAEHVQTLRALLAGNTGPHSVMLAVAGEGAYAEDHYSPGHRPTTLMKKHHGRAWLGGKDIQTGAAGEVKALLDGLHAALAKQAEATK